MALATFLESYRVMGAANFGRGARLSICWPFLTGGTTLIYRAVQAAINLALHTKTIAEQSPTEDAFIWTMVGLLLILNYTLGLLAGTQLINRIRELAERDFLTGCLNRRSIEARLKLDLDRNRRFGDHLGCILFDLDYFKRINDTYGHETGDAALKHVANIATGALRTVDAIGRFGGEEFLILLPGTHLSGSRESANRIRQLLMDAPLLYGGNSITVTASFGVSVLGSDETLESVIHRADVAMYEAKRLGRNRVELSIVEKE